MEPAITSRLQALEDKMKRDGGLGFNPIHEETTGAPGSALLYQDAFDCDSRSPWVAIVAASVVLVFAVIIVAGIVLILS